MRIYEHFGDRLDFRGEVLRKGDKVELDESVAAMLIDNDFPIRPVAEEAAAPPEVKNDVPV